MPVLFDHAILTCPRLTVQPFGNLFQYAYDRLAPKAVGTVLMIMLGSLLAVLFECVTVLMGVFHYTGWKYYSIPVYLAVPSSNIILFEHMKKVYSCTKI